MVSEPRIGRMTLRYSTRNSTPACRLHPPETEKSPSGVIVLTSRKVSDQSRKGIQGQDDVNSPQLVKQGKSVCLDSHTDTGALYDLVPTPVDSPLQLSSRAVAGTGRDEPEGGKSSSASFSAAELSMARRYGDAGLAKQPGGTVSACRFGGLFSRHIWWILLGLSRGVEKSVMGDYAVASQSEARDDKKRMGDMEKNEKNRCAYCVGGV
ncbi:hypothetical protein SODALDRAFT_361543 [Sodiomyces alkalinus F11]|uniref:Uncharacterized protein n=1 Tax=Sodiomyces alkalinus (strain CBS 110278 / VKM F-3762 / F11) TaxID=1314773 RepID=A0A3N2PQD7_SODAK|nr:hypothetical protein SODALDRAFT_361543 [Sodiomyces alkalinus F11]ROT36723.1 hypothetical protein SODALDRAFT_361543 [Sodiomyces alkalinus F11]